MATPEATKASHEITAPEQASKVPEISETNLLSLGVTELCFSSLVNSFAELNFGGSLKIILIGVKRQIG
ncbi:hypothetical protein CWB66_20705 [Pseudoalteromonas sp. S558]|nr:hypothetical protein CWB66_20705 [Pseudoalteromonas sp. S558]